MPFQISQLMKSKLLFFRGSTVGDINLRYRFIRKLPTDNELTLPKAHGCKRVAGVVVKTTARPTFPTASPSGIGVQKLCSLWRYHRYSDFVHFAGTENFQVRTPTVVNLNIIVCLLHLKRTLSLLWTTLKILKYVFPGWPWGAIYVCGYFHVFGIVPLLSAPSSSPFDCCAVKLSLSFTEYFVSGQYAIAETFLGI